MGAFGKVCVNYPATKCAQVFEMTGFMLHQLTSTHRPYPQRSFAKNGAAYRIRTYDPRITNAMLYQLS
jgi:hypothetical protein